MAQRPRLVCRFGYPDFALTAARLCLSLALSLAVLLTVTGRPQAAGSKDISTYYEAALEELEAGDGEAAIIHLRNALQENPEAHEARFLLGKLRLASGDPESAEKELRIALEANYTDEAETLLGRALLEQNRYDEVLEVVTRDALTDEATWAKLTLLADAYWGLESIEEAEAIYDQILDANAAHVDARFGMVRIAFARDQRGDAERRVKALLADESDYIQGWIFLADLALLDRDLKRAQSYLEQALSIDEDNRQALIARARVRLEGGDLSGAQQDSLKVLDLRQDDPFASYVLAAIDFARGDFLAADTALTQTLDALPNELPVQLLGALVKIGLEEYSQSTRFLQFYLNRRPGDRAVRRALGMALMLDENPLSAINELETLVRRNRDEIAGLFLIAEAYLALEWDDKAARAMQRIAGRRYTLAAARSQMSRSLVEIAETAGIGGWNPRSDEEFVPSTQADRILQVLTLVENEDLQTARDVIRPLRREFPGNPFILTLEGRILELRGEQDAARASYERSLSSDPDFLPALDRLDAMDLQVRDFASIEARNRELLLRRPQSETLIIRLANFLVRNRRAEDSIELLEEMREGFVESRVLAENLIRAHLARGNRDRARQIINEMLVIHEENADVLSYLRQILLDMQDHRGAVDVSRRILELNPRTIEPYLLIAEAQRAAGAPDQARLTLEQALQQDPGDDRVLLSMMTLELEENRPDVAIEIANSVTASDPVRAVKLHANVLLRLGRPEEAIELLTAAYEQNATWALAQTLYFARRGANRMDAAIEGLREWLNRDPLDLDARHQLASALIEVGADAEAAAEYESLLERSPENALVLNNLAWLRHKLGVPGALGLAERAYALNGRSPDVADTYGWILVSEQRLDEGVELLRRAAARKQDDPDLIYRLAFALNRIGERKEAQELLAQALEQFEEFPERVKAEALMAELIEG